MITNNIKYGCCRNSGQEEEKKASEVVFLYEVTVLTLHTYYTTASCCAQELNGSCLCSMSNIRKTANIFLVMIFFCV